MRLQAGRVASSGLLVGSLGLGVGYATDAGWLDAVYPVAQACLATGAVAAAVHFWHVGGPLPWSEPLRWAAFSSMFLFVLAALGVFLMLVSYGVNQFWVDPFALDEPGFLAFVAALLAMAVVVPVHGVLQARRVPWRVKVAMLSLSLASLFGWQAFLGMFFNMTGSLVPSFVVALWGIVVAFGFWFSAPGSPRAQRRPGGSV